MKWQELRSGFQVIFAIDGTKYLCSYQYVAKENVLEICVLTKSLSIYTSRMNTTELEELRANSSFFDEQMAVEVFSESWASGTMHIESSAERKELIVNHTGVGKLKFYLSFIDDKDGDKRNGVISDLLFKLVDHEINSSKKIEQLERKLLQTRTALTMKSQQSSQSSSIVSQLQSSSFDSDYNAKSNDNNTLGSFQMSRKPKRKAESVVYKPNPKGSIVNPRQKVRSIGPSYKNDD